MPEYSFLPKYEALRLDASKVYGEELYYFFDVSNAAKNLGGHTRLNHKSVGRFAVDPVSLGLDSVKYKVGKNVRLYPKSELWNYFSLFAKKQGLKLKSVGVNSFDDIIRIGYNRPDFHDKVTRQPTRRDKAHFLPEPDDQDPMLENFRKERED